MDDRSVTPLTSGRSLCLELGPPVDRSAAPAPEPGVAVENGMKGTTGFSPALSPSHFASLVISEKNGSTFSVIVSARPR